MNVYLELLKSLIDVIVVLREDGFKYKEIDSMLGLVNGTSWSAYRIMKRSRAKQYVAFVNA